MTAADGLPETPDTTEEHAVSKADRDTETETETDDGYTVITLRVAKRHLAEMDKEIRRLHLTGRPAAFAEMFPLWYGFASLRRAPEDPLPKALHIDGLRYPLSELAEAVGETPDLVTSVWEHHITRRQGIWFGSVEFVNDEPSEETDQYDKPRHRVTVRPLNKNPTGDTATMVVDYPRRELENAAELVAEYRRRQAAAVSDHADPAPTD